jgi:hypothetical protein
MTTFLAILLIIMFAILLTVLFITEKDYAQNGHWSEEGIDA